MIATWFGAGLLPKAPGTWGSLAALPFAWLLSWGGGVWLLLAATIVVFGCGLWAVGQCLAVSEEHDPGPIVIDEVVGQWATLLVAPLDPWLYALGFVLFRAADVLKPWPANWLDRDVPGALGVMIDDVVAALYAGVALLALGFWLPA